MSLREELASLEHEQWVKWSQSLIRSGEEINPEKIKRWQKLWVPYEKLSESMKDKDREWADRVLHVLEVYEIIYQFPSGPSFHQH